jgi:hypothetical protein
MTYQDITRKMRAATTLEEFHQYAVLLAQHLKINSKR